MEQKRSELFHFNSVNATSELTTAETFAKHGGSSGKKKVVFLGTPEVSANVLSSIFDASLKEGSGFEVAAVVSQPASKRGRGHKLKQSPVAELAEIRGLPADRIMTPQLAREDSFLSALAALEPDLCVTAAYGNFLPSQFLSIPANGTVNIHPSLLPKYRGASPVQRALQDGVSVSGVSVAYTVLAMDAGPIIASQELAIDSMVKTPELLEELFQIGTSLLLSSLPSILDGSAAFSARAQEDSEASQAAKVSAEEGNLSFSEPALALHNKVRAFAGWPGSRATFLVEQSEDQWQELVLKVITTRPGEGSHGRGLGEEEGSLSLRDGALCVPCGGGSVLEISEVQPPSKQAMSAKAFWNGLRGRRLRLP